MNIVILHGDDTEKSRARLEKFIETGKKRNWEIQKIDGETPFSLPELLGSSSLFQKERLFILEDILTLKKSDISWLTKKAKGIKANLIIYNDDFIRETLIKQLPKPVKVEEFKLPKIIFDFLSSFYPGNAKRAISLFHNVLLHEPPEFVFFLLARQLRDLYWVKVSEKTLLYPNWRIKMLKSQSERFSEEKLISIISLLSKMDVSSKTGGSSISESLDLAIITQLE